MDESPVTDAQLNVTPEETVVEAPQNSRSLLRTYANYVICALLIIIIIGIAFLDGLFAKGNLVINYAPPQNSSRGAPVKNASSQGLNSNTSISSGSASGSQSGCNFSYLTAPKLASASAALSSTKILFTADDVCNPTTANASQIHHFSTYAISSTNSLIQQPFTPFQGDDQNETLSISPDQKQAVLIKDGRIYLSPSSDLKNRTVLDDPSTRLENFNCNSFAWSEDSTAIIYATTNQPDSPDYKAHYFNFYLTTLTSKPVLVANLPVSSGCPAIQGLNLSRQEAYFMEVVPSNRQNFTTINLKDGTSSVRHDLDTQDTSFPVYTTNMHFAYFTNGNQLTEMDLWTGNGKVLLTAKSGEKIDLGDYKLDYHYMVNNYITYNIQSDYVKADDWYNKRVWYIMDLSTDKASPLSQFSDDNGGTNAALAGQPSINNEFLYSDSGNLYIVDAKTLQSNPIFILQSDPSSHTWQSYDPIGWVSY